MANTPEEFKEEWQQKVADDPTKYFKPEQLKGVDPKDIKLEFGSDEAIDRHLRGDPEIMGGICCLVTGTIPLVGGKIGISPPGCDPDNLCVR